MPFAVTHVLITIILVDLYRDYITKHKKYFTLHTIFIAGVASLLPDIDVPLKFLSELFKFNLPILLQHGGITHTPFFALLILIPGIILWKLKKKKTAIYFFVTAFAILFHIILDFFIGGGNMGEIMWLFPLSLKAWSMHTVQLFELFRTSLEAIILLAWLYHEEIKHKISDFI